VNPIRRCGVWSKNSTYWATEWLMLLILQSLTKNATKYSVTLYAHMSWPFWRSGLNFGLSWPSWGPTLENCPSWPLGGLEGQISRLAASLRPGDNQKRLAVWAYQQNKIPLLNNSAKWSEYSLKAQQFSAILNENQRIRCVPAELAEWGASKVKKLYF